MKEYQGSVIVIKDNIVEENIPFKDGLEAEKEFQLACGNYISNYDEYTKEDIETIVENGREDFGTGFIVIHWF